MDEVLIGSSLGYNWRFWKLFRLLVFQKFIFLYLSVVFSFELWRLGDVLVGQKSVIWNLEEISSPTLLFIASNRQTNTKWQELNCHKLL